MHILSVVANGVSGDSRVIKSSQVAASLGFRSTLVGISARINPTIPEVPGVEVRVLDNPPTDPGPGFPMIPQYPTRFDRTIKNLSTGTRDIARQIRPEIVHSHDVLGLIAGGIVVDTLRQTGSNVMWVHDVHEDAAGLEFLYSETQVLIDAENYFLPRVDAVTTVSDALASRLRERYGGTVDADVVLSSPSRSAVRTESRTDPIRELLGISEQAFLLVYIGNVKPARGVDQAIKAIAGMPDIHLAVVSDSLAGVADLNDLARIIGVSERVHLLPYVDHLEVTSFLEGADAGFHGLLPGPNAEVAMPNKLWEYLMSGLPVVFPDLGAMGEFIASNGLGETYESGNTAALVEALARLRADVENYRTAVGAFDFTDYCWEAQRDHIARIYEGLIHQR